MKQWVYLVCLFILGCISSPQSENTNSGPVQLQAIDEEDTEELHDADYGIFNFDINVHPGITHKLQLNFPEQMARIFLGDYRYQEFELSGEIDYEDSYRLEHPESIFRLDDFNFDGYQDLTLISFSALANEWSDIYLYNPHAKKFEFNELLSRYPSLRTDSTQKQIFYYNRGGFAGAWYESGTFEWINKQIQLIRTEIQTSADGNTDEFIRTIKTINAARELVVASKVHFKETEEGELQCLLEGSWEEFDKDPEALFVRNPELVKRVDGREEGCN